MQDNQIELAITVCGFATYSVSTILHKLHIVDGVYVGEKLSNSHVQTFAEKGTVLLSTSLAWPAVAGWLQPGRNFLST